MPSKSWAKTQKEKEEVKETSLFLAGGDGNPLRGFHICIKVVISELDTKDDSDDGLDKNILYQPCTAFSCV